MHSASLKGTRARPSTNLTNDPFTIGNNSPDNYARDQIHRGILDIHKTFSDGLVFRSVSGVQDLDTIIRNDDDGGLQVDQRQDIRGEFKIFTQEFSLLSPVENRFNWIVGAYYRDETLDFPTQYGFYLYDYGNPALAGVNLREHHDQVAHAATNRRRLRTGLIRSD